MYIVSDVVQRMLCVLYSLYMIEYGASDRWQDGEGLYRVWIYIASNVVHEGAVWLLQPVYDIIRGDDLPHCRTLPHRWTATH
jgi:hypothetical protein